MRLSNNLFFRNSTNKGARDKVKYERKRTRNILFCDEETLQRIMVITVVSFFAIFITSSSQVSHVAEAIPIPENASSTISNESQNIEASVSNNLKQAQQLMNTGNTTGAIQEIIDAVSLLSSARQDIGP